MTISPRSRALRIAPYGGANLDPIANFASVAALRAFSTKGLIGGELAEISGDVYYFDRNATGTDDASEIIKPDVDGGRWLNLVGYDSAQIDNVALLRATDFSDAAHGAALRLTNYAVENDGGGGPLIIDKNDTTTNDDGGNTFVTYNGIRVKRTKKVFDVRKFGARGTFHDDTASIQACVTAAGAYALATGYPVIVTIPAGQYVLSSTITASGSNIAIRGDAKSSVLLMRLSDYGDTISLTGNNVTVSDFTCYTAAETTSGAHIKITGGSNMVCENLFLRRQFGGLNMIGGQARIISCDIETGAEFTQFRSGSYNMKFEYNSGSGIALPGAVLTSVTCYSSADGGQVFPASFFPPEYGIQILAGDSIRFSNCYSGNAKNNVFIKSTASHQLTDISFCQFFSDGYFTGGPSEYGVRIEDDGSANANFKYIRFVDSFIGGIHYLPATTNTGRAVSINTSKLLGFSFLGGQIADSGKEAFDITNANNISIGGGLQIFNSNKSNTSAGVIAFSGACKYITVTNSIIGASTDTYVPSVCVNLAGTTDNVVITGNTLRSVTNLPIGVSTTGVNLTIENNTNETHPNIPSAATLELPANDDFWYVTGTTNISAISGGWRNRKVTLRFAGVLTMSNGGHLVIAGGTFVTTQNDTITLVFDGSDWFEMSRSIN